ncbi:UNVERIFIED_CONTAM: hypothetical protein Slati_1182700 [Sesamum latifolium]|uniref:Uncharacterized protein n=1 Tax=Sesamum latifolium TaxID=2727402 RepID=A0AAW2XE57_9LAMI
MEADAIARIAQVCTVKHSQAQVFRRLKVKVHSAGQPRTSMDQPEKARFRTGPLLFMAGLGAVLGL